MLQNLRQTVWLILVFGNHIKTKKLSALNVWQENSEMVLITDSLIIKPDCFICRQINIFTLEARAQIWAHSGPQDPARLISVNTSVFGYVSQNLPEHAWKGDSSVPGRGLLYFHFILGIACWSRKAGEILIVGVFKVKNNSHCKKVGSGLHTVHLYTFMMAWTFFSILGCLYCSALDT